MARRETTHLSVGAPDVGLGDGSPDCLGRFADARRAFSSRVDFGLRASTGGWIAGHTSGDRSLGLGENGSPGNGGRRACGLGDATRGSLRPATARHGVNYNAGSWSGSFWGRI
jgi:hypothetical protein